MKLIHSLKIAFVLVTLGLAANAYAGDAKVEADVTSELTISTLETYSDNGEAETHIGSIVAHGDSQVKANVRSKIRLNQVRTGTDGGTAIASVGSIIAGN